MSGWETLVWMVLLICMLIIVSTCRWLHLQQMQHFLLALWQIFPLRLCLLEAFGPSGVKFLPFGQTHWRKDDRSRNCQGRARFFFFLFRSRFCFFWGGSWFSDLLLLCFSSVPFLYILFCFLPFLLLCLFASLLFCFSPFLILCFLLCSSCSSAWCFPCFFPFLLLCFCCVFLLLKFYFFLFIHVFLLLYFLLPHLFAFCLYCLFAVYYLLLYSFLFVS